MFSTAPRLNHRLVAGLARVIVMDPIPASARLCADLLKDMGARQVVSQHRTVQGLEMLANLDPLLICIESMGPDFDGVDLISRLRRSRLPCRTAPVIMITGEATVESIRQARDAGMHEVLRKPYAAKDLFRRVENVVLKPRAWIEAQMYVGPDRRRFNSGEFTGAHKRSADQPAAPAAAEALDAVQI
jgi:DNA-binding response OmpR family regulator